MDISAPSHTYDLTLTPFELAVPEINPLRKRSVQAKPEPSVLSNTRGNGRFET